MQLAPFPVEAIANLTRRVRVLLLAGFAVFAGCGLGRDKVVVLEEDLAEARSLLDSLNFNEAYTLYRAVYPGLPVDDPHWPEAAFGLAITLWHQTPPSQDKILEAEGIFTRIAEAMPGSAWADSARLSVARIRMLRDFPGDTEDPAGAMPILQELLGAAGDGIRHEALLRLAECHRMDFSNPASLRKAHDLLAGWLAGHPDNPLAASMWEQIGWMELLDFKRDEPALDAFLAADRAGLMDPSRKAGLYWRIAHLAEATARLPVAVTYYQKLVREAPASGRAYDAKLALERIRATVPGMEGILVPELELKRH